MVITATEFKNNMGKYLEIVEKEDITITKNGKRVGVLVNPGIAALSQLKGIIKLPEEQKDMDYKELKAMRLWEKYESLS